MIKSIVVAAIALCIELSGVCYAGYKLVQDEYTAVKGDTLDSITTAFMKKNTYGKREHDEFRSGIIELNPWMEKRDVHEGDKIKINYWIEVKEESKK